MSLFLLRFFNTLYFFKSATEGWCDETYEWARWERSATSLPFSFLKVVVSLLRISRNVFSGPLLCLWRLAFVLLDFKSSAIVHMDFKRSIIVNIIFHMLELLTSPGGAVCVRCFFGFNHSFTTTSYSPLCHIFRDIRFLLECVGATFHLIGHRSITLVATFLARTLLFPFQVRNPELTVYPFRNSTGLGWSSVGRPS